MSALLAPVAPVAPSSGAVSLRPVDVVVSGARRLPVLVALSLLVVLSMGGLLALNIHIQDISFEYRALQERAGSLSNQEAELKVAVNTERSTATLAQRASLLGMVPYPYPATINLADGTISGELRPAVSSELARQIWNAQLLAPKLPVPQIVPAPKPSTTPTSPPIDGEGDAGETASASDDVEAGNQ